MRNRCVTDDHHAAQKRPWDALLSCLRWKEISAMLRLSRREAQVTRRVIEGKTISEIAREMGLAVGTVKTYSSRIHAKLQVTDQRELTLVVLDANRRIPSDR